MAIFNESYTYDCLNEASYKFWSIDDDSYLKKYKSTLQDAQDMLKDHDITVDKGKKRMRKALEILNIVIGYFGAIELGGGLGVIFGTAIGSRMKIIIFPIVDLAIGLISPTITWAIRSGNENVCASQGEETIEKMNKLINSIDDKSAKAKLIKKRDELENKLSELKEEHNRTSPKFLRK